LRYLERLLVFCVVFVLAVLGFELRTFHLIGRHSTTWAMAPAGFALVIFEIGSCVLLANLDHDPPIYASHRYMPSHPAFSCWDWVLQTFCPSWTGTMISISASCVAGMTGTCHHAQILVEMGVSWIFCTGWPQMAIFPISASYVAKIIGMSHWCLAKLLIFCFLILYLASSPNSWIFYVVSYHQEVI
jgi:hypothetical protein